MNLYICIGRLKAHISGPYNLGLKRKVGKFANA